MTEKDKDTILIALMMRIRQCERMQDRYSESLTYGYWEGELAAAQKAHTTILRTPTTEV